MGKFVHAWYTTGHATFLFLIYTHYFTWHECMHMHTGLKGIHTINSIAFINNHTQCHAVQSTHICRIQLKCTFGKYKENHVCMLHHLFLPECVTPGVLHSMSIISCHPAISMHIGQLPHDWQKGRFPLIMWYIGSTFVTLALKNVRMCTAWWRSRAVKS